MADSEEVSRRTRAETAVDIVQSHFSKVIVDLQSAERALENELGQNFSKNINPYNIMSRLKHLEAELPKVAEESQRLFDVKQTFIISARNSLLQSRALQTRMEVMAGLSASNDAEDAAYTAVQEVLTDWNRSLNSRDAEGNGYSIGRTASTSNWRMSGKGVGGYGDPSVEDGLRSSQLST